MRPHRWQLTRLSRPWDSPGKNTGVGCHFLLQCMKVKVKSLSHVQRFATPWTAAYQAPPSMGFSSQEYWSGVPLPSPHYRGLECKSRKSRNTWSNRQIWPWSTEWNMAKANRVLPRERTGHSKHPLLKTQEKTLNMDITRWSILKSGWLYSCAAKDGEALYSQQKQDQRLTVVQIMNSLLPNSDLNWRK